MVFLAMKGKLERYFEVGLIFPCSSRQALCYWKYSRCKEEGKDEVPDRLRGCGSHFVFVQLRWRRSIPQQWGCVVATDGMEHVEYLRLRHKRNCNQTSSRHYGSFGLEGSGIRVCKP